MSELDKAAEEFGSQYEYWDVATDGFLAGAAWQKARDENAISARLADWEQGILEAVNSGDATMADIRLKLRSHAALARYLAIAFSDSSDSETK